MPGGAFMFNVMAKGYAKQPIADQASYECKLEITRQYLTPESEVLEVGCGTGSTALLHAPLVKHIDATDYASKMIQIANEKLRDSDCNNIRFSVEKIEDLAAKDKRYDVILALNVIHLLEDKEKALKDMHKLLMPGGYCISSTVCIELEAIPKIWYAVFKVFKHTGLVPKVSSTKQDEFLQLIQDVGFTIEEQWIPPGGDLPSIFIVAKKTP